MQIPKVSNQPSKEFLNLVWETFFVARDRGVTMQRHFPWLGEPNSGIFFEIWIGAEFCGGLVVRKKVIRFEGDVNTIGLIGLVCVKARFRRRGLGSKLLKEAIGFANKNELAALTLWSRQHALYTAHQFIIDDPWLYGDVLGVDEKAGRTKPDFFLPDTFVENLTQALPPYAQGLFDHQSDEMQFQILKGLDGVTLASYQGSPAVVASGLVAALPRNWHINVVEGDPIIARLAAEGAKLQLSRTNLQMWLPLQKSASTEAMIMNTHFPLLERF